MPYDTHTFVLVTLQDVVIQGLPNQKLSGGHADNEHEIFAGHQIDDRRRVFEEKALNIRSPKEFSIVKPESYFVPKGSTGTIKARLINSRSRSCWSRNNSRIL